MAKPQPKNSTQITQIKNLEKNHRALRGTEEKTSKRYDHDTGRTTPNINVGKKMLLLHQKDGLSDSEPISKKI